MGAGHALRPEGLRAEGARRPRFPSGAGTPGPPAARPRLPSAAAATPRRHGARRTTRASRPRARAASGTPPAPAREATAPLITPPPSAASARPCASPRLARRGGCGQQCLSSTGGAGHPLPRAGHPRPEASIGALVTLVDLYARAAPGRRGAPAARAAASPRTTRGCLTQAEVAQAREQRRSGACARAPLRHAGAARIRALTGRLDGAEMRRGPTALLEIRRSSARRRPHTAALRLIQQAARRWSARSTPPRSALAQLDRGAPCPGGSPSLRPSALRNDAPRAGARRAPGHPERRRDALTHDRHAPDRDLPEARRSARRRVRVRACSRRDNYFRCTMARDVARGRLLLAKPGLNPLILRGGARLPRPLPGCPARPARRRAELSCSLWRSPRSALPSEPRRDRAPLRQ
jgi:hypothetical protein